MQQKNLKREVVKQRFVRSLGCNLILFPVTSLILAILTFFWLFCFKLYFFGDETFQLEPFQDKVSLAILAFITIGVFAISHALWNDAKLFYQTFSRYKRMREETSRIERLMQTDNSQLSDSDENVLYSEESDTLNQSKR